MIIAWVGGAVAAIAVAFLILQYVKPTPDPEPVVINDPVDPEEDDPDTDPATGSKAENSLASEQPDRFDVEPEKPSLGPGTTFNDQTTPGLAYRYFKSEFVWDVGFFYRRPESKRCVIDNIRQFAAGERSEWFAARGFLGNKDGSAL